MKLKVFALIVLTTQMNLWAQFNEPQIISDYGSLEVYLFDFDGDNDNDILLVNNDSTIWIENLDGLGNFGPDRIINDDPGWAAAYAGDINGDGDIDVVSVLQDWQSGEDFYKIVWFENLDGLGNFGPQQIVGDAINLNSRTVFAGDLDGDGDVDVLSGSHTELFWFENLDGLGSFGPKKIIATDVGIARDVLASDVDNDGDLDVFAVSIQDDTVFWHENIDGSGNFGPQQIIDTEIGEVWSIFTEDMNSDGNLDFLTATWYSGEISWYENLNGLGNFGTKQVISNEALRATSVFAADLDNDGDNDVLSATLDPGPSQTIAWYENQDGMGSFSAQQILPGESNWGFGIIAGDLDGDNDIDVIGSSPVGGTVWYENAGALAIDDTVLKNFSVIPNPTTNYISISGLENIQVDQIMIVDSMGKLVLVTKNKYNIDVSFLESGVYYLIFFSDRKTIVRKLIKY
ncbi:T9SS type A sorting domain-containing protein [uncultured Planktosalinus sp.]|uniref:T9SS type A sorting domain-containing protein n=1 Tax=uncultured Planktosalinus sp. TaxID=1810935 RepID=UPI0030DB9F0C